jgi:hypothetical protein
MKLKHFAFIWFWVVSFGVTAQDKTVQDYGDLITPGDLKENLSILASDALEGRETGTRGQKMAAAFISYHFNELGLEAPVNGSFYQTFELYKTVPGEVYLTTGGTRFQNYEDIAYFGKDNSGGEVTVPVVFAGKGRFEDFNQLDVAGKGVLILLGPEDDYRAPVSLARGKNAQMVFILNTRKPEEFKENASQLRSFLSEARPSLKKPEISNKSTGIFFVAPVVAEKILNTTMDKLSSAAGPASKNSSLKKVAPGKVSYKTSVEMKTIETENVLGYLEGTDKKDEVIVITSHYDHIGKKTKGQGDLINNGADDDGSGTVAVMQMAKVFSQAKKEGNGPRRSILFMAVTGEEKGLLGSEYYTENPVYPLAKTVVNLNIDMIGRRDEQHQDSAPYVYVIGADKLSTELHRVSESVNKKYTNLVFDYTYNDQDHPARLYYRSDHWNFAQKNIPIIFYFDGIHEDYHLPSDEVEKIEFDLLTARTQCIFYTAWEIANRDERIVPDVK